MVSTRVGIALVAVSMTIGATAAQADSFATLGTIPVAPMSVTQMKAVEGKQHIYNLVESRGVELPAQGEEATRFRAALPNKNFTPNPSRDAAAFPPR